VVLDKDFNIVAWNCFMEQLSGILCMDAMGKNMRELPPYTSDYHIDVDLNTVLQGDTIVIKDVPFTSRTDGSQKYATISYVPHRSVDNHIFGIIETVHDVTNRKLAVDKLLKTNEELHKAYLTQKAFLNNVTHEVRTPLTAVQGYCEMLIEGIFGPISEEQSDMINRILASSTQLMEIVNTILEMTRLSCGAPILRLKVCDPGMVLSQVLVTTTPLASRKSVAINIVDDSKDRLGMYDEQKLMVVITNLMTNAIKFTDRGSIDIFMEIEQNSTTITVADTGIGIKESQIETIFDEFKQLDFPGKHKPSGFGIGLSIVAAMIDVIGATLTVSSAQGVGTAFTLYLPVGDLASVTAQNAAENKS
jgi:PAS domain S-box-containing protein